MSESEMNQESAGSEQERKVSRRKVMQAGLVALPVLMTLPTVPAWGQVSQSTVSTCRSPNAVPQTTSCAIIQQKYGSQRTRGRGLVSPAADSDPFGQNVFGGNAVQGGDKLQNPFEPKK